MDRKTLFTEGPYFKGSIVIITAFFFFSALYNIKGIIVPMVFAGLLSMLVLPVTKKLESKISQGWAILFSLLLIILVISSLIFLFYSQIISLIEDFPLIREKAVQRFVSLQEFIADQFNIPAAKQLDWLRNQNDELVNMGGNFLKSFLLGFTEGMGDFLLVIIYVFFFLLFRHRIKNFLLMVFKRDEHDEVIVVVDKIKSLTIHYVTGLLIDIVALGTLNSIGFLIVGVRQAIFFGYLAAILNLIPYIGTFIGSLLPMFVAFIYKDYIIYPLGVLGVAVFTQFIDNNFLTPKIVGSHIRINELATIVVIVVGGSLWGLTGMILFLPLLGMLKIICDNIDTLKPIGYLIGEDTREAKITGKEPTGIGKWFNNLFKKKSQ